MVDIPSQIETIRKRPGMYFGSTTPRGLHIVVTEVVSNSLDQVLAGKASRIEVDVVDGLISVTDDGPGISTAPDKSGISFLEKVVTELHDSPTADGHAPHVHLAVGVGLAAVNAVCSEMTVTCNDGRQKVLQRFERGTAASRLQIAGESARATGTTISLRPDREIWADAELDMDRLGQTLRDLAWLTPGLITRLNNQTFGPVTDLREMFEDTRSQHCDLLHVEPILLVHVDGITRVDIALGWQDSGGDPTIRSFCNYRPTQPNGVEVIGLEEGLRTVFGQLPAQALFTGMVCVLSVSLLDPTFGDPTRHRLDSTEAIWLIADAISAGLPEHLVNLPELHHQLHQRVLRRGSVLPNKPPPVGRHLS